jgi:hypothetical protein
MRGGDMESNRKAFGGIGSSEAGSHGHPPECSVLDQMGATESLGRLMTKDCRWEWSGNGSLCICH